MSPRAAWRLEAAGFGPVYDYVAGKADWLAADLPFEGTAQLAGMFARRGVATVAEGTPAAEALSLLEAQGFGPVLVVNEAGVVMGAAYQEGLAAAPGDAAVVCSPAMATRRRVDIPASWAVPSKGRSAESQSILPAM